MRQLPLPPEEPESLVDMHKKPSAVPPSAIPPSFDASKSRRQENLDAVDVAGSAAQGSSG
jgi:hypothetical protein